MAVDVFYDELLAFLERREARLLSWGFYDVSFRAAEVEAGIANEAPASLRSLWEARNRLGPHDVPGPLPAALQVQRGVDLDAGRQHQVD